MGTIKKKVKKSIDQPTITTGKITSAKIKKLAEASDKRAEDVKPIKKVKGEKGKKEKREKSERVSMYKYPADCVDAIAKKNFRAKTRKSIQKLEKQLVLAKKGKGDLDPKKIEKELAAFKASTTIEKAAEA